MGRELSHAEAGELLGVYALDALDPDERLAVEAHAEQCGACQTEIAEHREVAAFLAPGFSAAPAGVWEKIAGGLEETPPPLKMPLAPVVPLERSSRPSRRSRPMAAVAAMVAVAAVALVGVLGYKVIDDSRRIDRVNKQALGTEFKRTVDAAQADPSARHVNLLSARGATVAAEAVVLPDGAGYLTNKTLGDLPSDRTYQLWALVGTQKISVGVLGPKVGSAGFRAPTNASGLALTEEQAGGAVVPTNTPVGVGTY